MGTALITEAVSTAHGSGCERFLATVQEANARYFEHHHFWRLETLCLLGRPHVLMQADLARYPAHLSSAVCKKSLHCARKPLLYRGDTYAEARENGATHLQHW